MRQMADITKNPNICNFLKDSSGLYACFLRDTTDPEPPLLYPDRSTSLNMPHKLSLPLRKTLRGLFKSLVRRKREMRRQNPLELPISVPGPFLSSLGCLLSGSVPILPSQGSLLRLTVNGKH